MWSSAPAEDIGIGALVVIYKLHIECSELIFVEYVLEIDVSATT